MRAVAWIKFAAMVEPEIVTRKPTNGASIFKPEALYHEKDVNALIDAAKKLIDLTGKSNEFSKGNEVTEAYYNIRKMIGYLTEDSIVRHAAQELADDIDNQIMKEHNDNR